ncbi:tetratricopeptide repeat protein [Terracidiphilus gabretensis]|jgi:tetratricopeptide (TPR) repeat protein|uniref:tetratricopeptide repeat protein n=1 Tax=Terracidiphilus gabretensis TaxID=1577687 RepID=UPI00071C17A3|nr:tetratricopeptide repeat protein [Terracidiphilus gabretensis]
MAKSRVFLCRVALPALAVLGVVSLTAWSQPPEEETASGAGAAMATISYATSTQQSSGTGVAARAATPVQSPAESEGDALMAHQRYQAAIEAFKHAPQDSAAVWNKMGIAYQLLYINAEALRCYDVAHHLEPKNASVVNNIGSIAVSARRFNDAEKEYRKAVKLDPTSPLFHKNLGTAYLSDHKYKKGWEEYRAALAIDPTVFSHAAGVRIENPTATQDRGAMNYYMARGCMLTGAKVQAIEYLRMALNEGFTNPKKISEDEQFTGLRDMPAFQAMMMEQNQSQR